MATTLKTRFNSLQNAETKSLRRMPQVKRGQLLSKSIQKTFHRYLDRPGARHAFVEAEAATFLAHQIRVLRLDRGWTQKDLAKALGTTQGVVSRLEDPNYGRVSFKTMVDLARVFDVAPVLKFTSTISLLRERWVVDRAAMHVPTFAEEAETVAFYEPMVRTDVFIDGTAMGHFAALTITSSVNSYMEISAVPASPSLRPQHREELHA